MEDSKIIDLFFAREERAIEALSIKYERLVRQIASNILCNKQDVEECINDTYLATWDTIPPNRPGQLVAYVCRITKNLSITRYRHNCAKKRNSMYDVALDELEECLSTSKTPEQALEHKELTKQLEAYLRTLSEQDQVIFVRRYWFADSNGEIAKVVGLSESNTSVKLHRIRKGLQKYLKKEGMLE